MKTYEELQLSIDTVVENMIPESEEFKTRFTKLITNCLDNSYSSQDILGLIDIVDYAED